MATPSNESKTADKGEPLEGTLPLRLTSVVVRGYGRGSNDLGRSYRSLSKIPQELFLSCALVSHAVLPPLSSPLHQSKGIPTANLSREKIKFNLVDASFDDLPTGVYTM